MTIPGALFWRLGTLYIGHLVCDDHPAARQFLLSSSPYQVLLLVTEQVARRIDPIRPAFLASVPLIKRNLGGSSRHPGPDGCSPDFRLHTTCLFAGVVRGLWAYTHNSSITTVRLSHAISPNRSGRCSKLSRKAASSCPRFIPAIRSMHSRSPTAAGAPSLG